MIFTTKYGRGHLVEVSTVDELDAFLDVVVTTGEQYGIQIAQGTIAQWEDGSGDDTDDLPMLSLGIGHPERSYLIFDGEGYGWGIDSTLPELDKALVYDCGGEAEERSPKLTRVTVVQAREAAREFIEMGRRPTNVEWFEPADEDYIS